jgi:hypothetical protein
MTAGVKAAQIITGIVAICCIGWGFGTGWFVLGMFALVAHFILHGLGYALRNDPTTRWDGTETDAALVSIRRDIAVLEREDDDLPYRPISNGVWPIESGAPE